MGSVVNCIDVGSGEVLVFQHGLAANLSQIESLFEGIVGYRLIAIDCPGHGQSSLEEGQVPSFNFYADLVVEQLRSKGIENAIFGGLSMGSGIALNIALRYPEMVKALILLRPAWLEKPAVDNLGLLLQAIPFMSQPEGHLRFEQLPQMQNMIASLPKAASSVMGVFAEQQQDSLKTVIESMVHDAPIQSLTELQKLTCPCEILASDDDPLHPYSIAEVLQAHITNSSLKKIESNYVDTMQYKSDVKRYTFAFLESLRAQ